MNQSKMNDIANVVSKQGQNVVAGTQYDLIQVWKSWYRGDVNNFHRYKEVGVDGITREREKLTFGMPKRIAEEWSSLIWNERVTITTNNEAINKQLKIVFDNNALDVEMGNLLEKEFGFAGSGATVEYLIDGETVIDYITGDLMLVTQGKGTQAKGLVTINEIEENDKYITHLTMHTLIDKQYVVEHQAFISEKQSELGSYSRSALNSIFTQEALEQMETEVKDEETGKVIGIRYLVIHDTTIPFFQVSRPNVVNNYDTSSKMGIPVIANSIDSYKALDNAYTSLDYEAVWNKTINVFHERASQQRTKTQPETGQTTYVNYIDKHNPSFISSPMNENEEWVKRLQGVFNGEPYINAINRNINWCGFKAGLGTKYWGFDGSAVYVNEKNIISDNSDIWKNKVKHEVIFRKALIGMTEAVIFLEQSQNRMPKVDIKSLDITVTFDDSIIQDDETLKQNSLILVEKGAKPMWKHLVEWENMTEDEAKQSVLEAIEESKLRSDSFFNSVVDDTEEDDDESEE